MIKEQQSLYAELEKLLDRILSDFMSTLIDLSGSQMAIVPGTHIRIPADVGYVNLYSSVDSLKLNVWLSETLIRQKMSDLTEDL